MYTPEELQTTLHNFTQDSSLDRPDNVADRAEALDLIQVAHQLLHFHARDQRWGKFITPLKQQVTALKTRLERANTTYIDSIRHDIQAQILSGKALRHLLNKHTAYQPDGTAQKHYGYDHLDVVVNGLIRANQQPDAALTREKEMIHYEPSPARVILDLVDQYPFQPQDHFFDLGSGLGSVAILVHLLSGVPVTGIEFEPTYCHHAQQCAAELNLNKVRFLNIDARQADYTAGTIFFMFTPFTGTLLDQVLHTLAQVAQQHPITLSTYGPCTLDVAQQPWLEITNPAANHAYTLAIFRSR